MITPIPNQPIRFQNESQIDVSCDCMGQPFCQLIESNDPTQFQLSSSNLITNGDFESNLTGWSIYLAMILTAEITNESVVDECDGEVTVIATGGAGGYTYSFDGGAYSGTSTFVGLCAGDYIIIAKDSNGETVQITVTVATNVDCSYYEGAILQDLIDDGKTLEELYNCTLDDLIL